MSAPESPRLQVISAPFPNESVIYSEQLVTDLNTHTTVNSDTENCDGVFDQICNDAEACKAQVGFSLVVPDPSGVIATKNISAVHPDHTWKLSFGEFYEALKNMVKVEADKDKAPYLFPVTFRDDTSVSRREWRGVNCIRKLHVNIGNYHMIVADFDDGVTVAEAKKRYAEYAYILHTSFTHLSPDSKGVSSERFRIFFPLKQKMTVEQYFDRSDAIFGGFLSGTDKTNGSRGRGFCTPVKRAGYENVFEMFYNDGQLLDALSMPVNQSINLAANKLEYKNKFAPSGNADKDLILEKLAAIVPTMAYDPWWKIIGSMAQAEYPITDAIAISDGTSQTNNMIGAQYSRNRADDRAIGSLITHIRKNGYSDFSLPNRVAVVDPDADLTEALSRLKITSTPKNKDTSTVDYSDALPPIDPVYLYNSKYCEYIDLQNGESFVKSPKGTGKTYQLVDLVKRAKDANKRVLLIGHRVSLLSSMSERIGLEFYKDMDDGAMTDSACLAICVNSIGKISMRNVIRPFDIVLIDESEQVLRHLGQSKGTIKADQRELVTKTFYNVVKQAKQVVLLDADLSSLTFDSMQEIRGVGDDQDMPNFTLANNEYIDEGRSLTIYENRINLVNHLDKTVDSGESVFFTCNSKKFVELYSCVLKEKGVKHVAITSANSDSIETQDFIRFLGRATDDELKGLVVLTTPSLGTGVDIQGRFDHVIGLFYSMVNTHQDMDQQLGRVRNPGKVAVYLDTRKYYQPVDPVEIEARLMRNLEALCTGLGTDIPVEDKNWSKFLIRLNTLVVANENRSKNNIADNFGAMKKRQGWSVVHVGKFDEGKQFCRSSAKKKHFDVYLKTLMSVESIDEDESKKLTRKRSRTLEDNAKLDRHHLEWFWQVSLDDTPECAKWSLDGLEGLVKAREWYEKQDDELTLQDSKEFSKHHLIDHNNQTLKRELLDVGMSKLGIIGPECQDVFMKDGIAVKRFFKWANNGSNAQKIYDVIGMSVDGNRVTREPIRVINDFIGKSGIKLGKAKRVQVNGERKWISQIDQDLNEVIQAAIERRAF